MPNYGAQTWPDQFLPDVAKRIADNVAGLTRDVVFASIYEVKDHLDWPIADKFITLFDARFPVDQKDVLGGGTENTAFDSVLSVNVFCRVEADIEHRSAQFLEDQTFGVYKFVQQVLTAIQLYNGELDSTANLYKLRWPMRVAPGWDIRPASGKNGWRWGVAEMKFEVSFVADLGNPYF